jgi:hypothetical protein
MVVKGTRKAGECIYCGQTKSLTKDHIPPKNLFAKPRPSNLITVPCCRSCNESFQKDDEYFQMIMHTRMETGGHAELNKTKAKFIASLNRKERVRFKSSIINNMFTAELVTKSGLYAGTAPALLVDGARINRVGSRIVQGLFFHETRLRLPDTYEAVAFADPLSEDVNAGGVATMRDIVGFMLSKSAKVIGNNVFSYCFHFHEEDEYMSAWLMTFYEKMMFHGSTLPKEDAERLNQNAI